jgi:hypothetical protein
MQVAAYELYDQTAFIQSGNKLFTAVKCSKCSLREFTFAFSIFVAYTKEEQLRRYGDVKPVPGRDGDQKPVPIAE